MSYRTGPKIVTDGLVLCLDAADRNSYAGSGNSWNDLTGISTITSLSATNMDSSNWSSDYGGIFSFDGSNEYINFLCPAIASSSIITVEIVVKIKETASGMSFGFQTYDFFQVSNQYVGYNTGQSDLYGYSDAGFSEHLNKWITFSCEMRSDVSANNNKLYVNAIEKNLSQKLGSTTTRGFNNGNGRISSWKNDLNYVLYMDLSMFRIYNRGLTNDEITQNYNATKGRFGL